MYKQYSAAPKKFGGHTSTFKTKPRFGGGTKKIFSNNSKPRFGSGGIRHGVVGKKRFGSSRGERIDFSRFIKKGVHVEEKPYVSKHTFADFPFNPQLHKNIKVAGFIDPRPIQDQAIISMMEGKDVFGMANTGTGKTAAFLLPLIENSEKAVGS